MSSPDPRVVQTPSASSLTLRRAFAAIKAELEAVSVDALAPRNADVPYAVEVALGAAPRIERFLPAMARLPDYDLGKVERMRTYAAAALYAHLRAAEGVSGGRRLPQHLVEDCASLRSKLLPLAEALAALGIIPAARVAAIRGGHGYRGMANSLTTLADLLGEVWPEYGSRMPIERLMIERAAVLGSRLVMAVGDRRLGRGPASLDEDRRLTRVRAWTLLVDAYEHCRHGIAFLRRDHGDLELYAPSLYPRRPRRPIELAIQDVEPEVSAGHAANEGSETSVAS